jgi:ABC-type uncharacterized transport system involved in gliding motility auxiliary subunit
MSDTSTKSMSYASLAIVAVLLLAVIALSSFLLRGMRLDLTENQLYTLSKGTRAILSKIDEPIHLNFFYSEQIAQGLPSIHNYGKRVGEMLQEMAEVSHGKMEVTRIDPEPFSNEEDRAVQLGIQAIPLSNDNETLYFGLAASNAVGENAVIPYFSTDRQSLLEYDLSKLLYQLSQAKKPVVGLLSSLNVSGGFDAQRMQATPPWLTFDQLKQFFQVRKLEAKLKSVPEEVDLLLIVHPNQLSDSALYAIDQFVLAGKHAVVFVDPYAESAVGGLGASSHPSSTQSDLKPLLQAWGVRYHADELVEDAKYALQVSFNPAEAPERHYAILGVRAASLDQDDVITQGLERINMGFSGALEPIKDAGTEFTPLIRSSDKAMTAPSSEVQTSENPIEMQRNFKATGKSYVLAARLSGKVKTAFPEGKPADEPKKKEDGKMDDDKQLKSEPNSAQEDDRKQNHLGQGMINVVVVGDTDLLTDRLWVQFDEFFGRRVATPIADNADFLINAVDNLLGSSDLISIRSHAGYARPFDRVDALRLEAETQFRAKEQELQAHLRETEKKINSLQGQKSEAKGALILSAEQGEAIKGFQQELLTTRKELRNVRHALNKNIENLGTTLKLINILLIPLLISLGGVLWVIMRRKRARTAPAHVGGEI